jgi:hypothetical protein
VVRRMRHFSKGVFMQRTISFVLFAAFIAGSLLAQEPFINRADVWRDTVKRGEMAVTVRGLGTLTGAGEAALRIPESRAAAVKPGQMVLIDTRTTGLIGGKVAGLAAPSNRMVLVSVTLDSGAPALPANAQVDGSIQITKLPDVVYVGRPVFAQGNSDGTLFRVDADGEHATRVKMRYGTESVNLVEVRAGLNPGDQVILSDMSKYAKFDHLRLVGPAKQP